jgi:hypothetical protein
MKLKTALNPKVKSNPKMSAKARLSLGEGGFNCALCQGSVKDAVNCTITVCRLKDNQFLPQLIEEYDRQMGKKKNKFKGLNLIDYDNTKVLEIKPVKIESKDAEIEKDTAEDDVAPNYMVHHHHHGSWQGHRPFLIGENEIDEHDPSTWPMC